MSGFPNAALPYSLSANFMGVQTFSLSPSHMTVTQKEFAHDITVLNMWADDVNADSYQSGMPMSLTWGRPLSKRTFYGYVNHAQRITNTLSGAARTARNSVTVTCVGASWLMNQPGTTVWRSQTADQIVAAIADIFGLSTDILPHPTVWPDIPMAGRSYWQFCVMLAKRVGYTFYCSGTQLVFKPRQVNPLNLTAPVTIYDFKRSPSEFPIFSPVLGVNNPSGGQLVNRLAANVDPRTEQTVYSAQVGTPTPTRLGNVVDSPIFNRTEHFTVDSQTQSDAKIVGSAQSNQMYLTASAKMVGNPRTSQGSLIFTSNANGSQNGLWFVSEATHTIDSDTYSMDLCLGRDSMGATNNIFSQPQTTLPTGTKLSGSNWVSA